MWAVGICKGDSPATPHSPKPELRIVDPLLTSATASSADLYTFEPPRLRAAASVADHRGLHVPKARRGEGGELLRVWTGAAGSWRARRGAREGARARVRRAWVLILGVGARPVGGGMDTEWEWSFRLS